METTWIMLGVISFALLAYYWNGKNSVWGGLIFGLVIGLIVAIFSGFTWITILKGGIIGVLAGFVAEILGKLSDQIKN